MSLKLITNSLECPCSNWKTLAESVCNVNWLCVVEKNKGYGDRIETYNDDIGSHISGRSVGRHVFAPDVDGHCWCKTAKPLVSSIHNVPLLLHILMVCGFGIIRSVPHILSSPWHPNTTHTYQGLNYLITRQKNWSVCSAASYSAPLPRRQGENKAGGTINQAPMPKFEGTTKNSRTWHGTKTRRNTHTDTEREREKNI